jgi:serine/threonine-protein kinase
VETLAAAYAELGDFDEAIRWQKTALDVVTKPDEQPAMRARLTLYEARKPYRDD